MKKYLSVLAIPALMGLGSCVQDDLAQQGGLGEEVMAKISLSLPGGDIQTKAGGGTATPEYAPSLEKMRLFVSIYDEADNLVQVLEDGTEQSFADGGKYSKTIRLITGKTYKIVAWADVMEDGDKVYYEVSNDGEAGGKVPFTVSLKDMDETSPEVLDRDGNDVNNDAYFVTETKTLEANGNISLTMKRPFGLVKVTTTDWDEAAVKHVVGNGEQVSYTTTINVPTELNLLDGTVSGNEDVVFSGESAARAENDENTKELSYDYIFASEYETDQSDLLNFEVDYANGENSICSYEYSSIPLKRNYITNVSGNILTKAGNLTIEIDPAWAEDEIDHILTEVSTDKELQDAVNNAEDGAVIVLKPGTYSEDIELDLKEGTKNITIQGSYAGNMLTRSGESGETVFTGTLFANRVNTDKVEDVKVVIDGVKFQYGGENNGVACIGNTQYNAIGELVVQNCIFVPSSTAKNNYFIATNHKAQDDCRSVIKLYNNTIGTADGTYDSYYPVRLWSVKQVEVIGNKFTVPERFTGLQHINISKLSADSKASIIVKDNTFINGNSGVTISSWAVGEGTYADNFYTGKIEVTGNTFVNVAPNTIENPLRNNVPIFISPEYVDDDVTKGRAADHGQFDATITVEDNVYQNYTPRENVVVNKKVFIKNAEDFIAAAKNQMDGQVWYISDGNFDVTEYKGHVNSSNPGWFGSALWIKSNDIKIIGSGNTVIYARSNQQNADGSYGGQNTITVDGNNVSIEGVTVKAIEYDASIGGGGNKAICLGSVTGFKLTNSSITPASNNGGGSFLMEGKYTGESAYLENVNIKGSLITRYMKDANGNNEAKISGAIKVKNVTVSSIGTGYSSPLSHTTNAANVINVESNFVTEIDNKTGLPEYIKGVPANTTIKLAAGEYNAGTIERRNINIIGPNVGVSAISNRKDEAVVTLTGYVPNSNTDLYSYSFDGITIKQNDTEKPLFNFEGGINSLIVKNSIIEVASPSSKGILFANGTKVKSAIHFEGNSIKGTGESAVSMWVYGNKGKSGDLSVDVDIIDNVFDNVYLNFGLADKAGSSSFVVDGNKFTNIDGVGMILNATATNNGSFVVKNNDFTGLENACELYSSEVANKLTQENNINWSVINHQ